MFNLYIDWNTNPEMFTIPGIDWPVRWYGLLWAIAFITSHFIMDRVYRTEGRSKKELDTLTIYIVVGTVLGARIGHCFFYDFEWYSKHPGEILKVWKGGLASHGGAIGIIAGMLLYCYKTKENWLWLFDRIAIVVPISGFLIRIANLINGEIVGTVTNVPWAFVFHNNEEDKENLLLHGIPIPPRHPAQLYESIFCLFLFILIYWLWRKKRNNFGPGFMFGLMCVLLFIERFLDEFVKENQVQFEDAMTINMGQILSIPFILAGAIMIWRSFKLPKYPEKRVVSESQEPKG